MAYMGTLEGCLTYFPPWEKENHIQKCLGRGYDVSFQESLMIFWFRTSKTCFRNRRSGLSQCFLPGLVSEHQPSLGSAAFCWTQFQCSSIWVGLDSPTSISLKNKRKLAAYTIGTSCQVISLNWTHTKKTSAMGGNSNLRKRAGKLFSSGFSWTMTEVDGLGWADQTCLADYCS